MLFAFLKTAQLSRFSPKNMAKMWRKLGNTKNQICDNIITSLKTRTFPVRVFVFVDEKGEDKNDIRK